MPAAFVLRPALFYSKICADEPNVAIKYLQQLILQYRLEMVMLTLTWPVPLLAHLCKSPGPVFAFIGEYRCIVV